VPPRLTPVLVLATSGREAEVGLTGKGPLRVRGVGEGAARGRDLIPCVRDLLSEAGLAPKDLAALAVDLGPGSFTGVRLGVTAAKSLAFALGTPVIGVSSLLALGVAAPASARALALRDAGRGTVYAMLLGPRTGVGARPVEREAARLEAVALRSWPTDALLVGEDAVRLAGEHGLPQRPLDLRADAAAVLALALPRLEAGERTPPAELVPLYLQASAPERLLAGEPAPASRPKVG